MAEEKLSDAATCSLLHCLFTYQNGQRGMQINELCEYIAFSTEHAEKQFTTIAIRLGVSQLETEGLAELRFVDDEQQLAYCITSKGINFVTENLDNPTSKVSRMMALLEEAEITRKSGIAPAFEESDKAVDVDDWEPIPLDRQDSNLSSAIDALNEARDAIASDNGYSANNPDERNAIVKALDSGIVALKDQDKIFRIQFRAMIWEPLLKSGKQFRDSAVGVLITTAKELLVEYFKEHIKGLF